MLRLAWDNSIGAADLQLGDLGALATDGAIETAVLLSLFTDREATAEEIASAGLDQQRGWWADAETVRPDGAVIYGSKLWLLTREKTTLATLRRAEGYALDALLWLRDRGIAGKITVTASRPRLGWLALEVVITRPNKLLPPFKRIWELESHVL